MRMGPTGVKSSRFDGSAANVVGREAERLTCKPLPECTHGLDDVRVRLPARGLVAECAHGPHGGPHAECEPLGAGDLRQGGGFHR